MPDIRYAQNENVDRGDLRMQVIERGTSTPIDDAKYRSPIPEIPTARSRR